MNLLQDRLVGLSLEDVLNKIEAPGHAISREARPLLDAYLASMEATEEDLGQLAPLFLRWLDISGTMDPKPPRKAVVICCADHGVAAEGVSAYPQETTLEMVRNYTVRQGGAANAFAAYAGAHLLIDDMGIAADTGDLPGLFLTRIASGLLIAKSLAEQGFDWFLPGEMGIANTTASAAIAAVCCRKSPEEVTGRGTNISDARLQKKVEVVRRTLQVNRPDPDDAIDILAKVGGFEFGCMAGLILGAALHRKLVILDGANCGAAALLAQKLAPASIAYTMASHFGSEKSHRFMLESLGLQPILHLDLRLGEAIGSSIASNILEGMIASWQALRREESGTDSPASDHCEMREEEVKLTDKTFDFYLTTMPTPDREAMESCKLRIDNLTKPVDSLGCLEQIAAELAGCSGNERPDIETSRMAMICFTAQDSVPPAMEDAMAAQAGLTGARLAIAQLAPGKSTAAAFDFGREEGERYAVMNEVIALAAIDGEGEPCGAMNRALREALLTESGALRFKGDNFLGHVPPRYQGIVSSLLGAMIAAAHNGAMIVLDSEAVQIVARYAARIAPELRSCLLPVEPPLTSIGAQLPGLAAACGLQIIRASLFMLNEMKTFNETNVSTASDGPGAKRQHR